MVYLWDEIRQLEQDNTVCKAVDRTIRLGRSNKGPNDARLRRNPVRSFVTSWDGQCEFESDRWVSQKFFGPNDRCL